MLLARGGKLARPTSRSMDLYRGEMVEPKGTMLQSVLPAILANPDLRQRYCQELILPVLGLLTGHFQARSLMG